MSLKTCFLAATLTASALTTPAFSGDVPAITIEDAYARVSSPNAKVGAVFFEVENHSAAADRLLDVTSDVAARVELHTHKEGDGGIMQMLHVPEGFAIPPQGHHALKRGGDHVMLMGLNHSLNDGDIVPLTLVFENAGEIMLEVPVDLKRSPQAGANADQGHTGHAGKGESHQGHSHGN